MFRSKESSNRIELSRLVQDVLNFGFLGSLRLWGGGRWVRDVWGHLGAWEGVPTHMHTHVHVCTHMHAYVYMYRNCKWPPTWRHPCLSCLTCMCMHVCVCLHAWDTLTHTHTHPHPISPSATPQGDPRNQLKFDNT